MNRNIKYSFEILRVTRRNIINIVNSLSYEQCLQIPKGFSNSILWNLVHLYITPQLLFYGLSNNEKRMKDDLIDQFRKGSKGSNTVSEERFNEVVLDFVNNANQLESDYEKLSKTNFNKYTTSYNITLSSVEEVANFNNSHEALHFGVIMQLRKFV